MMTLRVGQRYGDRVGNVWFIRAVSNTPKLVLYAGELSGAPKTDASARQWFFPDGKWSMNQKTNLDLVVPA